MEEKKSNKTKVIINTAGIVIIVAAILTILIPFFNTPNYSIYYSNVAYPYNSSGVGVDLNSKQIDIKYSDKVLSSNDSNNGYKINLDYIKKDNSNFTLDEQYVDIIFETKYELTGVTIKKAANFELKTNDVVLKNTSVTGSATYTISKINVKTLTTLEIYEKESLSVIKDSKDSTISYKELNVKVIYFGR